MKIAFKTVILRAAYMNRTFTAIVLGLSLAACTSEVALDLPQVSPSPPTPTPTPSPTPSPSVPTVSTSFAGPALSTAKSTRHVEVSGLVPMGTTVVMKSTQHTLISSDLKLAKDRLEAQP